MKKQIKKYFKPVSLKVASFVLVAASLVSYVAGLLRDLILSYFFGASGDADVYYTAFLVPDLVFNLTIAGVIGGVFIPIFREKFMESREETSKLAGAFILSSQTIVLFVSFVAFLTMPLIASTFFGQASLDQQQDIVNMSRIILLSPIIFSLSNALGAVLMSFKHYLSYALSPALYNLGIIAGIVLFHEEYGIYGAAIGVVAGLVLHLLVRVFDLANLDFKFKWSFKADGLWEMYKLSFPKTLGLVFWQLSVWVYNIIGYSLVDGSISAYNYARNVQSFAVSLFGIALATAVFPFLVDSVNEQNKKELAENIERTGLKILFYTIPSAVGLGVLSVEVTRFLFGRGAFDEFALVLTSGILFLFAISIPFESLVHLLSRVYYAFKNTWTPVLVNLLFLGLNVWISFKYATVYGAKIFALSFSIGTFLQVICLLFFLKKYISLNYLWLFKKIMLITFAAVLMGFVVFEYKNYINIGFYLNFVSSILVGVLFYFLVAKILGILEIAGIEKIAVIQKIKQLIR
jgi:putative peptidoglycan lipid II flippase